MRKNVAVITAMVMLFTMFSGFFVTSNAGNSLKEGDYVKFGAYHGAAILWRVVDFDESGDPLLITDQIITSKPFTIYHANIGFNEKCWETSFIRKWLNAEAGEGKVKYIDEDNALANPINSSTWNYNALINEAGFLSSNNFTVEETKILKESTQKVSLVGKYAKGKEGGKKEFSILNVAEFRDVAALSTEAYYKNVNDKIFIMNIEQANDFYQKFGDYINTSATYESMQYEKNSYTDYIDHYYSGSGSKQVALDKPVDFSPYYLRDIINGKDISPDNYSVITVGYANVGGFWPQTGYGGPDNPELTGVRPACYIDMSKASVDSGSGTKTDPYRFDVKNIFGNNDTEKPQPVRVVGMWSKFIKFTEASGIPFVDGASRTQVPLRMTMENLFAKVTWDSVSKTAIVEKNGIKVEVPVGKNYIVVNGIQQTIDTSAQIVNGKTYLPIKSVVVALGGDVSWDPATKTVIIKGFN